MHPLQRMAISFWLAASLWLLSLPIQAEQSILILNSNHDVEKYRAAEHAFVKTYNQTLPSINLGEKYWTSSRVREKLYADYPDIVYAIGAKAYLAAHHFIGEKTVVFSSVVNYRRLPSNDNRYGVAQELHGGMQVMLMRHLFPNIKKLATVYSENYTAEWFKELHKQGAIVGLEVVGEAVTSTAAAEQALQRLLQNSDAAILLSDPLLFKQESDFKTLLNVCDQQNKLAIGFLDALKPYGIALIIAIDTPTTGRQAANIVKRLVAGKKPKKTVVPPAGSRLVLNLKKVRALNATYNQAALANVNEIIE